MKIVTQDQNTGTFFQDSASTCRSAVSNNSALLGCTNDEQGLHETYKFLFEPDWLLEDVEGVLHDIVGIDLVDAPAQRLEIAVLRVCHHNELDSCKNKLKSPITFTKNKFPTSQSLEAVQLERVYIE